MDDNEIQNPLKVTSVVVVAILLVGVIFNFQWIIYSGITLLGLALLSSTVNEYFAWLWMAFARAIGTINSKILLTIIFYGILTPIALFSRIIRGTPIKTIGENREDETYFETRNKTFNPQDFEDPW